MTKIPFGSDCHLYATLFRVFQSFVLLLTAFTFCSFALLTSALFSAASGGRFYWVKLRGRADKKKSLIYPSGNAADPNRARKRVEIGPQIGGRPYNSHEGILALYPCVRRQ